MASIKNDQHEHWKIEEIDYDMIDRALVRDDETLFYLLSAASFVEILSGLYSKNLIEHFSGNDEAVSWLDEHWQREEAQHGLALKAYVQMVWPEFNWDIANDGFRSEYGALCTTQQLECSCALEMVARCVVETGTTTFYHALHDYSKEPVLKSLLAKIMADETHHYAHFRHYFDVYNTIEKRGAMAVTGAIWRRIKMIRSEDAYISFKHAYVVRHPGKRFRESEWRRYNTIIKNYARIHYPYLMACKMLSKLIPLAEPYKRMLQRPLIGLARLFTHV